MDKYSYIYIKKNITTNLIEILDEGWNRITVDTDILEPKLVKSEPLNSNTQKLTLTLIDAIEMVNTGEFNSVKDAKDGLLI